MIKYEMIFYLCLSTNENKRTIKVLSLNDIKTKKELISQMNSNIDNVDIESLQKKYIHEIQNRNTTLKLNNDMALFSTYEFLSMILSSENIDDNILKNQQLIQIIDKLNNFNNNNQYAFFEEILKLLPDNKYLCKAKYYDENGVECDKKTFYKNNNSFYKNNNSIYYIMGVIFIITCGTIALYTNIKNDKSKNNNDKI